MKNLKALFHYISYLQYPLMLVGLYYVYKPLIFSPLSIWVDYNKALVFVGLAISFSTLQDTAKTQNKFSKRVWENPKFAKMFFVYLMLLAATVLAFGIYCLLFAENKNLQELSFGVIAFGAGLIGLLKSAVEMAENHQQKN
jgi:F0F1-type ATP synthase membrane subunit c/vacuolar-type H+-ATPase subunit K